jgi:hypothetical protein
MAMYLVRDKETKQICGIVDAESLDKAFYRIDEFADASFYEVTAITGAVWFCVEDEEDDREHPPDRLSQDQEPSYYSKEWTDNEWDQQLEEYGSQLTREDYKREREKQFNRSSYVPDPIYLDFSENVFSIINGNEEVTWVADICEDTDHIDK